MAEEKQELGEPRPRRRLALILIPLVVVVAGAGVWFLASPGGQPAEAKSDSPVRSTLHLETFVLNLADTSERAYLRIGIDLGLNQEPKQAAEAAPVAQVRDTIVGVLGDAKVDDLLTSAGKTKLKQEIQRALRERVPQLGVEDVYFTEFLIQR